MAHSTDTVSDVAQMNYYLMYYHGDSLYVE